MTNPTAYKRLWTEIDGLADNIVDCAAQVRLPCSVGHISINWFFFFVNNLSSSHEALRLLPPVLSGHALHKHIALLHPLLLDQHATRYWDNKPPISGPPGSSSHPGFRNVAPSPGQQQQQSPHYKQQDRRYDLRHDARDSRDYEPERHDSWQSKLPSSI